jgi:hypothetical protein
VSRETIQKYPESDLNKIMDNSQNVKNGYIHMDEKDGNVTLYIDADPDVMKTIIRIMRGGTVNIDSYSDPDLLRTTLEKLKLSPFPANPFVANSTTIKSDISAINTTVTNDQVGGDMSVDTDSNNLLTSEAQNRIGLMFGGSQKYQLSDELTEFSSDIAKNLDASIKKKSQRKLKPKLFNISD